MKNIRSLFRRFQVFFLLNELRRKSFSIGGYEDKMVRITGIRFLKEWEVKIVHQLRESGRLVDAGESRITSPTTGVTYVDKLYLFGK